MTDIKGVIFDYGGTIDSRGDHWAEVIWDAYRAHQVPVTKEQFRDAYVATERLFAREPIIKPDDTFAAVMHKKIACQFRELGLPEADAAPVADACYRYARQCVDEARPALEELHRRYPMVLVSNFYGNINAVLRDFHLDHLFADVVESAVVGVRKPDPAIFALGVKALGLEPQQVLVVGDSLRKDILPARSLGCQTAWIKGRGWTAEEDAATDPSQIPSLATLLSL